MNRQSGAVVRSDAMKDNGMFLWKAQNCADGEIAGIVAACKALGLRWVALKMGDAAYGHTSSFVNMLAAVKAFQAAGIRVFLWHYVYGGIWYDKNNVAHTDGTPPEQEATFALRQIAELKPDGYIIDAEREWKGFDAANRAKRFMNTLGYLSIPTALTSYRFPSMHREFPFYEFAKRCDAHMPQVYWQTPSSTRGPVHELVRSVNELKAIIDMPFSPIGRAYIGDGHPNPLPSEITDFAAKAIELGCDGISFWALDYLYLHQGGAERAAAIAEIAQVWPGGGGVPPAPEPEPLPTKVRVRSSGTNIRNAAVLGDAADIGDLVAGKVIDVVADAGNFWQVKAFVAKSVVDVL